MHEIRGKTCRNCHTESEKHPERNVILKHIEGCFTFMDWNNHYYKTSFFPKLVQYNPKLKFSFILEMARAKNRTIFEEEQNEASQHQILRHHKSSVT